MEETLQKRERLGLSHSLFAVSAIATSVGEVKDRSSAASTSSGRRAAVWVKVSARRSSIRCTQASATAYPANYVLIHEGRHGCSEHPIVVLDPAQRSRPHP